MRKMFLLFGMLALVGVLFVACTDEQATAPSEPTEEAAGPDFSFQFPGCEALFEAARPEGKARALFRIFDGQIIAVSLVRQVRRNAYYGNYDRAAAKAWQLADLVQAKLPGRLVDPCGSGPPTTEAGAAMLMNDVFELAGVELPEGGVPPAALGPDGGLWVVPAGVAAELVANSYEGALRILEGTFPSDAGDITVVAYRLPDDYTGEPDFSFGDYTPYLVPEKWFFDASVQPIPGGPGFEAWMCVVEDPGDPGLYDRSSIAHALDGGGVELLDGDNRLTENPPADLDCTNAGAYQLVLGPTSPGWLQFAGRILEPVVNRVLDVNPLNAMYFAGKGLGGRGGSLSPFSPADVGSDLRFYTLDVTGTGNGTGSVEVAYANLDDQTIVSCTYDGTNGLVLDSDPELPCQFLLPPDTNVDLLATADDASQIGEWTGCSPDGPYCDLTVDGDRSPSIAFYAKPVLTIEIFGLGSVWAADGIICENTEVGFVKTCHIPYPEAIYADIWANPSAEDNYTFAVPPWGGACAAEVEDTCLVESTTSETVEVYFEPSA